MMLEYLASLCLQSHIEQGDSPQQDERKGTNMGNDVKIPGLKPDVLKRLSTGSEKNITDADIAAFKAAVRKLPSPTIYQQNLIKSIQKRIKLAKSAVKPGKKR